MKRIVIFASGSGTNMERIAEFFQSSHNVKIILVVCNKVGAGVIGRAEKMEIPVMIIDKPSFYNTNLLSEKLLEMQTDLIVLAGFLWLVPSHLLHAFPNRIINIHPALLPKFGGKGMYGEKVHEAVIAAGEKYSGITIHYVNEHYDSGDILFQKSFEIALNETPASLAARIHVLEHTHFPKVIDDFLKTKIK
ncbi:MAG: phosphoribosylglycinamide formyltransferase [Bacteroidetes bacterium HGW-Bacteroidetes-1]|jgi:phosphoribosylglycinamide formyltransferase-1|nr:MAG: phosphoribosylglycinamide formyltransferase [Bacteroidetes bacterium HGW-Bacteroidetes-1]